MMAYAVEMMSVEKVVSSVKRFSNFSASKELPYDLEDAMIFWINKVIDTHWCQFLDLRTLWSALLDTAFVVLGEHKDEGANGKGV